jgi:DNA-binding NarL/FixJ family response regulator
MVSDPRNTGRPEPPPIGRALIIGREGELAAIDGLLDGLLAAQPGVLLFSGEAGIGKSRLLVELTRRARERGIRVADGQCLDEIGMPPYVPWVGALGSLRDVAAIDSVGQSLIGGADDTAAGSAHRRLWVFDSLVRALINLALETPLLVVIDDLQWSDPSSNQLLRYVVAQLSGASFALAGAYRSEEVEANREFGRTLADWDHRRMLQDLRLSPLSADQTARLLRALAVDSGPEFVTTVRRATDGNPFLIEEVARAFGQDPQVALAGSRGATAVIVRRLESLPRAARETVELASLAGREIDPAVVAAALGRTQLEIAAALDEAVAHALLVRVGAGALGYRFLHDRVREAVAAQIVSSRGRRLHALLLSAFDIDADTASPTRLAAALHHAERAALPERAASFAGRLAAATYRAHAFDEAAAAAETALRLGPPSAALFIQLGDARLAAGLPGALDAYREAHRVARGADPLAAGRTLHRLGVAHMRREEFDDAVEALDAAIVELERFDSGEALIFLAEALIDRCQLLGLSLSRYTEAVAAGRRALDLIAKAPDDPARASRARQALAATAMRAGRLDDGRKLLEPALAQASRANRPDLAAEAAGMLANHAYWTADLEASERYARRRREHAVAAGDPFALRHALPWLANIAMARGDFSGGRTLIAEARVELARVDSPEPHAFIDHLDGMIELATGEPSAAVPMLERAIAGFRRSGPATLPWYLGVLALAYLAAGDRAAGAAAAEETAELVAKLPQRALPRASALGQLGLAYLQLDDVPAQRRTRIELEPFAGQHHWVLIDRVRAELAVAAGDAGASERVFASAGRAAVRGGLRPELALTQAARARWRRDGGDRTAETELAAAVDRLRALGLHRDAARHGASPAPALPAGLTRREAEVLALVARGWTNRQIGDELGISEKTVTNHLTHIFTKAHLENRSAAVAFAIRRNLA